MRRSTWLTFGAAGVGGLVATRAVVGRRGRAVPAASRSAHAVTVARPVDYVAAHMPEELADGGDAVEVRLREAPGDRGTEIHVRRANDEVSDDDIREALRTGKSRLETGDVLQPGVATTTPTMLNRGLRAVTRRGRRKGLL